MRELWKEGNSYGTWLKDINFFLANLKSAINSSLSKRKPKKKGMPRVLHKLVERYASNPDEKLRKKIHDKLSALEDVNICSQETNYHAPLVLVARYGLVEEASILLDKGADPNFTNERLGFYTALVYACDNGHLNMVKLLIKSGANSFQESDIDAKTGRPIEMIDEKENVEIEKYHSSIALSCAVKRGNLEIIDFLLTRGIDINKTEMLRIACEAGNTKSVAHLIKLGVDLDKVTKTGNEPPLHFAVCGNHFEIVKQLLESGANPNIVEKYRSLPERTILDLIEDRPNSEVFKLIRSFGGLFYKEIREKRSAN